MKIIWTKPPWLWVQNVHFPGCTPSLYRIWHPPKKAKNTTATFDQGEAVDGASVAAEGGVAMEKCLVLFADHHLGRYKKLER